MSLAAGTTLGRYEILGPLGAGGMGEVYRARDTRLNRQIAIKILPADVAGDGDRLRRFRQEAEAASALNHPNIVTIHDFGDEAGLAFIVMELVPGESLRNLLARGPLPPRRAAHIVQQIAEGLAQAHAAGIVHRDLKPENVMVTDDGRVKIVDFGLAKLKQSDDPHAPGALTQSVATAFGAVLGTVGYMSPEQAHGRPADHRSDQFSLGLIAYEAITGRQPFARPTAAQTLSATIEADPPRIETLNPDVPAHLALVIHRCLEKDPADRYESTRDLARDLQQSLTSPHTVVPSRARRPFRREVLVAGALLLLFVVGAGTWLWRRPQAPEPSTPVVAVRVFRSLSPDPSQSFFAEGMTDEIRGQLSKISALRVMSRSAVNQFGDADGPTIARQFGTSHLVDGSVRIDGSRVRVAVELVDAATQHTRWSDQFDRELADVLTLQREVALQIAQALAATLSQAERERFEPQATLNPDAYALYLKAEAVGSAEPAQNLQAIGLYEQALALDPRMARAKAALARRVFFRAYLEDRKYADDVMRLAQEAAEIDPTFAEPHFVLGGTYGLLGRLEEARHAFLRALELDPNHSASMHDLSYTYALSGRLDESLYWARRAWPLSARGPNDAHHITTPLLLLRDDELTGRWIAYSETLRDLSRTQILAANYELYRGDIAAALARMRARAQKVPNNAEVRFMLNDLAIIASTEDAESLNAEAFRTAPDVPGFVLPASGRLRYAFLRQRRGDPQARALIEESETRMRARIASGDRAATNFMELGIARALLGDVDGAFAELDRAYEAGWRDYGTAGSDPMLGSLRDDPRFRGLLDRAKADVAAQRERARARGLFDLASLIGRPL